MSTSIGVDIELTADTPRTPRVLQMAAMFDMPLEQKLTSRWSHRLPIGERDWNVGLIVGPSGSGKSVLARRAWPDQVRTSWEWPDVECVLDAFPDSMGIRDVTSLLTSVGLGSAPSWLRPYRTLSNGEQFRADMARAIAEGDHSAPVVVDEFTSVVDRQVAQVAAHCVQKTIRRQSRQFIAVTCHYDVTDWLQPDWLYDVAASSFAWRSVQPHPRLNLDIHPAPASLWGLFAHHHYLSPTLHRAAHCYAAWVDGAPVAFTSYRHFPHAKVRNIKMGHRLVVLPDWQGLGIAGRLDDWLGQYLWDRGYRYRNVVSHPAMIAFYSASPRWQSMTKGSKRGAGGGTSFRRGTANARESLGKNAVNPRLLGTRSFEFRPPAQESTRHER